MVEIALTMDETAKDAQAEVRAIKPPGLPASSST
jgi:hypothetical protein